MAGAAVELKVLIKVLQESGGLKALLTDVQTLLESLKNIDSVKLQNILQQIQQIAAETVKATGVGDKGITIPSKIAEPDDTHVTAIETKLESDPVDIGSRIAEPDDTHVTAITTKLEKDPVEISSKIIDPDVTHIEAVAKKLESQPVAVPSTVAELDATSVETHKKALETPIEIPAKIVIDPATTKVEGLDTVVRVAETEKVTLPIDVKFPSPTEIAEKLRTSGILGAVAQPDGGFTYQPVSAAQPTSGFALSLHKEREQLLPIQDVTVQKLVDYVIQNRDLLRQPDQYLGGWHNPKDDQAYLDISTVVKTREEAEQLGRANKQLAYFDLAKGKSVEIPPLPPVELKVDTGQATQKVEELANKIHQFAIDGQPVSLDTAAAKAKVEEVASAVQSIAPVPPKFPEPDVSAIQATKTKLESETIIIPSKVSEPTQTVRDTRAVGGGEGPPKKPWVTPTLGHIGDLPADVIAMKNAAIEAANVGSATAAAAVGVNTLQGAMGGLDRAANFVTRSLRFMMGGVLALGAVRFLKGIADVAARTEVLGTVLHVVGNNAGYTNEEIDKVDMSIRKLGITAQSSRQSITQLLQSKMKLEFAPALARASQDLAVIAGWNSSVTFQRLILNIQQLDTMGLRWMGIVVSRAQAEEKYAQKINKTAEQLTQRQKVEALTQAVLEKAVTLQGTYEAAMGDVGKQLTSMQRYTETLKEEMGEGLLPAYLAIVEELTLFYQRLILVAEASNTDKTAAEALGDAVRKWARNISDAIMVLVEHKNEIIATVELYLGFKLAVWAMTAAWRTWLGVVGMVEGFRKALVVLNAFVAGQISLKVATEAMGAANAKAALQVIELAIAQQAATARAVGFTSGLVVQKAAAIGLTTQFETLAATISSLLTGWVGLAALAAVGIVTTIVVWRHIRDVKTPGTKEHDIAIAGQLLPPATMGSEEAPATYGQVAAQRGGSIWEERTPGVLPPVTSPSTRVTRLREQIVETQKLYEREKVTLGNLSTETIEDRQLKEQQTETVQRIERAIAGYKQAWEVALKNADLPEVFRDEQTRMLAEAMRGATEIPVADYGNVFKDHPEWRSPGDDLEKARHVMEAQNQRDLDARVALRKAYAPEAGLNQAEIKAAEATYAKVHEVTKNGETEWQRIKRESHQKGLSQDRLDAEEAAVAAKKVIAERQALSERETQSLQDLYKGKLSFGERGQVMSPGATTALGAYETQLDLLKQMYADRDAVVKKGEEDSKKTLVEGGKELLDGLRLAREGFLVFTSEAQQAYVSELRAADSAIQLVQSRLREGIRLYADLVKTPEDRRLYQLKVEDYLKTPGADPEFAKKMLQEADINVTDYLNSLNAKRIAKAKEWHKIREDQAVQVNERELVQLKQHHQKIEAEEEFRYANGLMLSKEYYANRRERIQAETDAEVRNQLTKLQFLQTLPEGKIEERVAKQTQIKAAIAQLEQLMGAVEYRAMEVHRLEAELEAEVAKPPKKQQPQVVKRLETELVTAREVLTTTLANPYAAVGEAQLRTQAETNRQKTEEKQLIRQVQDMTLELAASYGSLDAILEQIAVKYDRQAESLRRVGVAQAAIDALQDRDQFNAKLEYRNKLLQQWVATQQADLDLQKARIDAFAGAGWITTTQAMQLDNTLLLKQMDNVITKMEFEETTLEKQVNRRKELQLTLRQTLIDSGVPAEDIARRMSEVFKTLDQDIEQTQNRMTELETELYRLGASMSTYGKQLMQFFTQSLAQAISQSFQDIKKAGEMFHNFFKGLWSNIADVFGKEISERITRRILETTSQKRDVKDLVTGEIKREIVPGTNIFDRFFKMLGLGTEAKPLADGTKARPFTVDPGQGWWALFGALGKGEIAFANPAFAFSGKPPSTEFGGMKREIENIFQTTSQSTGNRVLATFGNNFTQFLDILKKLSGPKMSTAFVPGFIGGGFLAEGGVIKGPGTGTSDSIPAMVSAGEYFMPADKTTKALPLLEGIRQGHIDPDVLVKKLKLATGGVVSFFQNDAVVKLATGGVVKLFQGMPAQMPHFALGGVVGEMQSIAIPSIIPRHYVGGGVVVSDAGAAAVTPGRTDGNMTVQLHPDALNMTMREWLEHEVARQQSRR